MNRWILFIIAFSLSVFLAACNSNEVIIEPSREDYQAEIQVRLDELNQQIEALKTEAEQLVGDEINAEDVNRAIAELEAQADVAAQELEALGAASVEAWQDFKPGLEAALDELEKAYEEARVNFERS